MNIAWRIGSNWGKTNVLDLFKQYKIAFVGIEVEDKVEMVKKGDLACITNGQPIVAIGKISHLKPLIEIIGNKASDFENVNAICFSELYFQEQFPDIDFQIYDGMGKQFHKVEGEYYKKHINSTYNKIIAVMNREQITKLLGYKHQIILQGPPGTGKTRLAKIIAESITMPSNAKKGKDIENYFKNYSLNEETKNRVEGINETRTKFLNKFPIANILNLTLDKYCFGQGDNNNFCWWIEYGLFELGAYTGVARKFLIYWSRSINDYKKSGFIKNELDDNEALKKVLVQIHNVISETNIEEGSKYLGKGFILKLLNTYHPDKYFPINSEKCLNNALTVLNVDFENLNFIEKNLAVQHKFQELKNQYNNLSSSNEFANYLFDEFNIGGELSISGEEITIKGEFKIIQFHPSYSYEDFVRGIIVQTNESALPEYKIINKTLIEFAEKALANEKTNYVLIIDEINRANLTSVLGELIYALEYRYDKTNPIETSVESMYKIDEVDEIDTDIQNKLKLPKNLKIIGTMNTADRSVGHIDYAIRRRFAFVDVLPTIEPIREAGLAYFKKVCGLFIKNFDSINWNKPVFEPSEHLAPDFKPNEVMLGHSYFITKEKDENGKILDEKEEMQLKLEFEIIPILKEYIKDGILNDPNNDLLKDIC